MWARGAGVIVDARTRCIEQVALERLAGRRGAHKVHGAIPRAAKAK